MISEQERQELHRRLAEIQREEDRRRAAEASARAVALHLGRVGRDQGPPLRMR